MHHRRTTSAAVVAAAFVCAAATAPSTLAADLPRAAPVVVELFTSEGCSSCPPADAALLALASAPPRPGVEIIALEEHVDYWNHLGWVDPFSSPEFSRRQAAYERALRVDGAYTPQMVIDGRMELVGSRRQAVADAVSHAATDRKLRLAISSRSGEAGDAARVRVDIQATQPSDVGADVWLAITEDGLSTSVAGGENGGRTLAHGPVVRVLERVGAVGESRTIERDVRAAADWKRERLRIVAFVQEPASGHVIGAAAIPFPSKSPR
jgi:hypothetical protein